MITNYRTLLSLFLLVVLLGLVACRNEPVPVLPTTQPEAPTVAAGETPIPPTATAIPPTATTEPTATAEATAAPLPTATVEPSPTATLEEADAAAPTATALPPTAMPTLEPVEGEPAEIVRDFLDGFMAEAAEAELVRYLDGGLRTQLAEEETIAGLLGIAEPYRSFALTLLDDGSRDGEAEVRAALSYADPVYLRFLVSLHDNGSWYISAVEPAEAPAAADDPGEVVNEFLTSLLYDRTGGSSLPYLNAALQQEVAGGRRVFDLLGVDRVYNTFSYEIVNDGSRSGSAIVEATLGYAAGPVTATFTLTESDAGWRISQISSG